MTRASEASEGANGAPANIDHLGIEAMLADAPTIGEGIRRERLRRGLTLAQLATQVHLTVSALSQIERGASDPSISSLRRIAQAFNIPMFQFLVGTDRRDIVVRRNQRTKLHFSGRDIEYELVSPDTIGEFEVLGLTLAAGAATGPAAVAHLSEECSLVLRGHVLAEVAGRTYELDAGDSIKIHRELPHRFVNQSSAEAELVIIISPPTF
jgi:transcriptional regulator with XRE-family HTH domain